MSDNTVTVISSQPVFNAKLFDVEEYRIKSKTGEEKIHYIAKRLPTVVIFPITAKYEIYLVSEYRYMLGRTVISAAAGFMDKEGERPLQTAQREAKEELGVIAQQWEQLAKIDMAGSVFKAQAHLFLARDIELTKNSLEEDEEIEVIKMSLEEAVKKVMVGEINNSATMIGLLMLDRLKREGKI